MCIKKLKIVELFGGIGACTKALEKLNIPHEVVDYVEIDVSATKSYNAIHNTNFEPQDITQWDKDIEVDMIMHGSPCTSFSKAGKQEGGDEGSGTASSLMYEALRIVKKLKPKYVIWENVPNILADKHIHNFDNYQITMRREGYNNYYQVLNSKDYGIPQRRERVFTVSIRKDVDDGGFVFPDKKPLTKSLDDILETNVDEKYYLSGKNIGDGDIDIKQNLKTKLCNKLVDENVVKGGEIINHSYTTSKQRPKLEDYIESTNGIVPTLTTRPDIMGYAERKGNNVRIRKLTPRECWRLMGFDDEDFDRASQVNSSMQLYKQARK